MINYTSASPTDEMRWDGQRYVKQNGQIVADIREESGSFVCMHVQTGQPIPMAQFISVPGAKAWVDWWETFWAAPARREAAARFDMENPK